MVMVKPAVQPQAWEWEAHALHILVFPRLNTSDSTQLINETSLASQSRENAKVQV